MPKTAYIHTVHVQMTATTAQQPTGGPTELFGELFAEEKKSRSRHLLFICRGKTWKFSQSIRAREPGP